ADWLEMNVWTRRPQERRTAGAARTDACARWQALQIATVWCHQDVARVLTHWYRAHGETFRELGRNAFEALDGDVDFFAQKRRLQLLDKDASAPIGGRTIARLTSIAAGRNDHGLHLDIAQRRSNERGLGSGQGAAARADSNHARAHAASRFACSH